MKTGLSATVRALVAIFMAGGLCLSLMAPCLAGEPDQTNKSQSPTGTQPTAGRYSADWESLRQYPQPEWLADAKFGIWFHWGVYSVPAHWGDGTDGPPWGEWYGNRLTRNGPTRQWHEARYGPLDKFGYQDLIPLFKAEKFDADAWADVFAKSGAKYAGPCAIHHDGFAMWDSDVNRWCAAKMGPKKDLVGLLEKAIRAKGLKFMCSMHHEQNQGFWRLGWKDPTSCVSKPEFADLYGNMPKADWDKRWEAQTLEIIDKYHPDLIWFDGGLAYVGVEHLKHFAAHWFNVADERHQAVALANKSVPKINGVGVMCLESHVHPKIAPFLWIMDETIDNGSWGYVENNRKLNTKTVPFLVRELIAVSSWNGVVQLNLSPKADGTLPEEQVRSLLGVGEWLNQNGEAIYGTRPWRLSDEGQSVGWPGYFKELHFTAKGDSVYAMALKTAGTTLTIRSLRQGSLVCPEEIDGVRLLGHGPVQWTRTDEGLRIDLPEKKPNEHALSFQIKLKGRTCADIQATQTDDAGGFTASAELSNFTADPWSAKVRLLVDGHETTIQNQTLAAGEKRRVTLTGQLPSPSRLVHQVALAADAARSATVALLTPRIPLAGQWKFKLGDAPEWSRTALDENGWETVSLPATWHQHSKVPLPDNGKVLTGWYRKSIRIPAEAKGHGLKLTLGNVRGDARVYFNERPLGETTWNPEQIVQSFEVPPDAVNCGGDNVLAVRVRGEGINQNMGYVECMAK